jgi:hypothetical protein
MGCDSTTRIHPLYLEPAQVLRDGGLRELDAQLEQFRVKASGQMTEPAGDAVMPRGVVPIMGLQG